jgi:hypothetical protein
MRALFVFAAAAIAAAVIPVGPAAAEHDSGSSFTGIPQVSGQFGSGSDFRGDRRRLRGTDTILVYDREYQGDTAWRAESFNDWWHERPNRAYPAWVQRNRDCQRKWWQGETLTC